MLTMSTARIIALAIGIGTAAGCAPTQLGENYGTAYLPMKESQILNPDAGRNGEPVVGMEGPAAMTAIGAYRKTFERPDAEFQRSAVTSGVQTK